VHVLTKALNATMQAGINGLFFKRNDSVYTLWTAI